MWTSLTGIMLDEWSQVSKSTCWMITIMWNFKRSKINVCGQKSGLRCMGGFWGIGHVLFLYLGAAYKSLFSLCDPRSCILKRTFLSLHIKLKGSTFIESSRITRVIMEPFLFVGAFSQSSFCPSPTSPLRFSRTSLTSLEFIYFLFLSFL